MDRPPFLLYLQHNFIPMKKRPLIDYLAWTLWAVSALCLVYLLSMWLGDTQEMKVMGEGVEVVQEGGIKEWEFFRWMTRLLIALIQHIS